MSNDLDIDLEAARAKLLALQAELEGLSKTSAEGRKAVELDQQSIGRLSRMDALQVQAMALEQERCRAQQKQRIAAALKRIETGDYGYCIGCDEPIARKRLDHDPATPVCIDCAK